MRYQLFGRSALRVSEICLGTMTMGEEWGYGASKEESLAVYNAFREAGGNFIDTANRYTEGSSERFLGEFMSHEREEIVMATKYTLRTHAPGGFNDGGNHRKNLVQSLEGSLRRLRTDYIDILYVHAWDNTVDPESLMRNLEYLVSSGKVLHIAISDTPAWVVSMAQVYAELRGWEAFCGLQVEYSLIQRTPERDLLPMAQQLGIAVTAWAPLAGGALSGKYLQGDSAGRVPQGSERRNDRSTRITQEVVALAQELGATPAQVALAWVRQKGTIPIVGARNAQQLKDSLGTVNVHISAEAMARLDEVSAIEVGFPHDFLAREAVQQLFYNGTLGKLDR